MNHFPLPVSHSVASLFYSFCLLLVYDIQHSAKKILTKLLVLHSFSTNHELELKYFFFLFIIMQFSYWGPYRPLQCNHFNWFSQLPLLLFQLTHFYFLFYDLSFLANFPLSTINFFSLTDVDTAFSSYTKFNMVSSSSEYDLLG